MVYMLCLRFYCCGTNQSSLLTIANSTDRFRRLSVHSLTICRAKFGAKRNYFTDQCCRLRHAFTYCGAEGVRRQGNRGSPISDIDFDMHSLTVGRSQALRQRESCARCESQWTTDMRDSPSATQRSGYTTGYRPQAKDILTSPPISQPHAPTALQGTN